ncbi:hypothetical protein WA016_02318 [Myxococcus stipitatus]
MSKGPLAANPSAAVPGATQAPPRSTGPILFVPVEPDSLGAGNRSARWANASAVAVRVARLPGTAYLTFRDVRETFRDKAQAAATSASTGLSGLSGAASPFRAAVNTARALLLSEAARALLLSEAARVMPPQVGGTAAAQVTKGTALEPSRVGATAAAQVTKGTASAPPRVASTLAAEVLKAGARPAPRDGEVSSTRLGVEALRVAMSRAGGRFAPGFDVSLAMQCTATAANTLCEPGAAMSKKVTSGVSSVGAIVAATHIPVVSQSGAVVSMASHFVGTFL